MNMQHKSINKSTVIRNFNNIGRQQGWTFWSLSFVLAVVLFFSYCLFQLVPIYSTNGNIVNAMKLSVEEADRRRVTRKQIIRKMDNQLYLDGSHDLLDYKNEILVRRDKSKLTIEAKYNRKVPLFFNLGILVEFTPIVECELDGQCTTNNNIL